MGAPDWPRMMRRRTAALYCDVKAEAFEREVAAGRLPAPVLFGGEEHWSRPALDEALNRLTGESKPDWRKKSGLYNEAA